MHISKLVPKFVVPALLGAMVSLAAGAQSNKAPAADAAKAPPAKVESGKAETPKSEAVIGYYRFKSGLDMNVYLNGEALTVKSTGQPPQALTASEGGRFNYPGLPAYLTFDLGPDGKAKTLHFHFDEKSLPASRIDAAAAQKASEALALKIKNQTHNPKCMDTLKRMIEELRTGKPDYSKMTLTLAQATRMQLPMIQERLKQYGAIKEAKFNAVGQMGAELFDVTFENGAGQFVVSCLNDGYVSGFGAR